MSLGESMDESLVTDLDTKEKRRGQVLNKAIEVINGERQDAYGNPEDNFSLIAQFWNVYINKVDLPLGPHDVAVMMTLMKVARIASGTQKEDSYVDAAGYIGLAADMAAR